MKILALSDVHVGSGLGYGRTPADRMGDFDDVLYTAAKVAIRENVDAVLFGGDLHEGPVPRASAYRLVERAFCEPLCDAGIQVVAISGNGRHDSAAADGEDNALSVHHRAGTFDVHTRAALHRLPGLVVACVPWASTARLRAMLNGGQVDDTNAAAAELVVRICADLRARAEAEHPGVPCVLVSHFATTGWKTPTGLPTDGIRDVVLPLEELERLAFDAVFLGHIHAPGVINEIGQGGSPSHGMQACAETPGASMAAGSTVAPGESLSPIISLGSPICLNFGEEHVEHGCWLLEPGTGSYEFVPIASRRFVTVDYRPTDDLEVLYDDPVVEAIVRVRYEATPEQARRIDHGRIEDTLLDAGAHKVWQIEANVVRESRARVAGVTAELSPLEAVDLWAEAQGLDASLAKAVRIWTGEALEAVA